MVFFVIGVTVVGAALGMNQVLTGAHAACRNDRVAEVGRVSLLDSPHGNQPLAGGFKHFLFSPAVQWLFKMVVVDKRLVVNGDYSQMIGWLTHVFRFGLETTNQTTFFGARESFQFGGGHRLMCLLEIVRSQGSKLLLVWLDWDLTSHRQESDCCVRIDILSPRLSSKKYVLGYFDLQLL